MLKIVFYLHLPDHGVVLYNPLEANGCKKESSDLKKSLQFIVLFACFMISGYKNEKSEISIGFSCPSCG